MLVGCAQTLGEVTMLGYFKFFPANIVSGWASGTGMAGLFGSAFYIMLKYMDINFFTIYMSCIPLVLVYYLIFK